MAWDRYVAPFSYGLWLALAIAVCALSVCLSLTNCGHDRNQGLTVPSVLFYIHACFCQQGQQDEVSNTSRRIVIFTSHVTSLVLMAAFSAFLISRLAVQTRHLPFTDLQGLLHDGSYKLGVMEDIYLFHVFDRATEGIESAVYKKLIAPFKNDMPVSELDGFRRVCDDHKYAYIGFLEKYDLQKLSCQVVPLPETSYTVTAAYVISKNNPYRGLINWRLAQLRETGIQDRIRKQYEPLEEPEEQPSTIHVSMVTVAPILVVLTAGYVIGDFVMLIERWSHGNVFKCWPPRTI